LVARIGEGLQRAIEGNRSAYLRKRYGLTLADYEAMEAAQGGVCALCAKPPVGGFLRVDHCHRSGRVRGLLCPSCNTALSGKREDVDWLSKAVKYVQNGSN